MGEFSKDHNREFTDIRLHPDKLTIPLSWKKPKRIFVNSMSDLFHEQVPFVFIDEVFKIICQCRGRHTFQILTKRPQRMYEWFQHAKRVEPYWFRPSDGILDLWQTWLGVSVENQAAADERIPWLLETAAAVRFLSVEPLLGPVDLTHVQTNEVEINCLTGDHGVFRPLAGRSDRKIDWIIIGGESGPGARPCDISWVRSIVEQCKSADVSCFVKQLGAYPILDPRYDRSLPGWTRKLRDKKGGDIEEWPADIQIREYPKGA